MSDRQSDNSSAKSTGGSSGRKLASIKIAASQASQRTPRGGADPGPGDLNAAPSVAPQLVEIPEPPTSSQLVVKSASGQSPPSNLTTLNEGRSGTMPSNQPAMKSSLSNSGTGGGSKMGPAASHPSIGAPREPTSSRQLSKPPGINDPASASEASASHKSQTGPAASGSAIGSVSHKSAVSGQSRQKSHPGGSQGAPKSQTSAQASGSSTGPKSPPEGSQGGPVKSQHSATGEHKSKTGTGTGTQAMGSALRKGKSNASSPSEASGASSSPGEGGVVHVEDEEGEGELENQGEEGAGGAKSPDASASASTSAVKSAHGSSTGMPSAKSGTGKPVASSSGQKSGRSEAKSASPSGSSAKSGQSNKDKKVTKFRYHKRITVRTHGKTSPKSIMDKVNKKNHQQGITPSTIEDMDPQELMKRAGIKGNNKTHWRVRLRQTKRLTKNGKTVTQTKVAYRDSEGNKRVKTSSSPFCKKCGKPLEQCKCDVQSQS